MNKKRDLEVLTQEFARLGPILPGSISEQYSVCGKSNCHCQDKLNPQKHGPRYQLSYTIGGKSSTMYIKDKDVETVTNMTESYRRLRLLSTELALESIKLSREIGPCEAEKQIQAKLDKAKSKTNKSKPEPSRYRDLEHSRDKWKERAIKRGGILEQNRLRLRDLEQSREKWRNEALPLRQTVKNQGEKIEESRKELIVGKEELLDFIEDHKKKSKYKRNRRESI